MAAVVFGLPDHRFESDQILAPVPAKATFWEQHRTTMFNERRCLLINKLFDGFDWQTQYLEMG